MERIGIKTPKNIESLLNFWDGLVISLRGLSAEEALDRVRKHPGRFEPDPFQKFTMHEGRFYQVDGHEDVGDNTRVFFFGERDIRVAKFRAIEKAKELIEGELSAGDKLLIKNIALGVLDSTLNLGLETGRREYVYDTVVTRFGYNEALWSELERYGFPLKKGHGSLVTF